MLISQLYIFYEDISIQFLCLFFFQFDFLLSFESYLYILAINPLSDA